MCSIIKRASSINDPLKPTAATYWPHNIIIDWAWMGELGIHSVQHVGLNKSLQQVEHKHRQTGWEFEWIPSPNVTFRPASQHSNGVSLPQKMLHVGRCQQSGVCGAVSVDLITWKQKIEEVRGVFVRPTAAALSSGPQQRRELSAVLKN